MLETYFWLCLAAAAAGAINAVAGGGTLLTFPALFAALGTSDSASVLANGTSTVALVPASLAAIWGYRRELAPVRRWVGWLAGPSLIGSIIGSVLVVLRPETFK
ncbi:MAG TPA: sulfite exporter TauE/SafE family protein, partial [Pirellulales bacterium]|nr:sulfite exporter TauE/SafE family protein [Pirellulales bacterium]